MAPVTSAANNPYIGNYKLHPDVMSISRDVPINQLEIVAQPYQAGCPTRVLQKAVIIPLAEADAMAALVEGHTRNYDQVRLIRLMVNTVPARFKNSETARTELLQALNPAQHHLMATDGRVEDPLAGFEGDLKYQPGIDLVVGRRIERNAVRPGEFLQGQQPLLGQPTGPKPLIATECPTLYQHLLAKRLLRHDLFSLSEGTCLAEHNKGLCPVNEPERVIREGKGAEWLLVARNEV